MFKIVSDLRLRLLLSIMTHWNCTISTTVAQVHSVQCAFSTFPPPMANDTQSLFLVHFFCLLAAFNRLKLSGIEAATAQKCSLLSVCLCTHPLILGKSIQSRTHVLFPQLVSNDSQLNLYQFCTFIIYIKKEKRAGVENSLVRFGLWFACAVYTTATTVQAPCAPMWIENWNDFY